jgi:hypothetical protein
MQSGLRRFGLRQAPLQACTAEHPNGQVCRRDHRDHPQKCTFGRPGSVQVFKAAEHIEASDAEDRRGDAEGHKRPAIRNGLPRNSQLLIRHRFALPQLAQSSWDASDFLGHRQCWTAHQPHHEHGSNCGEHYYGREGHDRQNSPQAQSPRWPKARRGVSHCYHRLTRRCSSPRKRLTAQASRGRAWRASPRCCGSGGRAAQNHRQDLSVVGEPRLRPDVLWRGRRLAGRRRRVKHVGVHELQPRVRVLG